MVGVVHATGWTLHVTWPLSSHLQVRMTCTRRRRQGNDCPFKVMRRSVCETPLPWRTQGGAPRGWRRRAPGPLTRHVLNCFALPFRVSRHASYRPMSSDPLPPPTCRSAAAMRLNHTQYSTRQRMTLPVYVAVPKGVPQAASILPYTMCVSCLFFSHCMVYFHCFH